MPKPIARAPAAARAIPWAVCACVLWGSAFAIVKRGLEHVEPLTFAGWRFMLAGLLLLPFCLRPKVLRVSVKVHWRLIVAVSLLQTIILYGSFFLGMNLVAGAQGAVILGSSPLVAALVAHVLIHNDRMTVSKACTIALGMVGVVILAAASKPWSAAGLRELAGMGLLTVGVLCSAIAQVLVARARHTVPPLALNSLQMGPGGMVLFAVALAVEGVPRSVPPAHFLVELLWLAGVSAAGFSIWFALLRRVKYSYLNMWKFLIPVCGGALSWLLVPGESPNWPTVTGMVFVAGAVALTGLMSARQHRLVAELAGAGDVA
jgi:drug/metabolite transporter (DMT)-like permease